jgi:hypothetical protein
MRVITTDGILIETSGVISGGNYFILVFINIFNIYKLYFYYIYLHYLILYYYYYYYHIN